MHDVIIDDTRTSLAVTTDKGYREIKPAKKRRSFSIYLIDWVEKALIIAGLISVDFLLFAGAGSYNMFSSMTFFSPEVLYILAGIFITSIVLMYLLSFSSFFQNVLTSFVVAVFVVVMLNQFAAFDKNSMLSRLVGTYISQDLGLVFNYVSHLVLAGVIGFIFFLFLVYASKKLVAYFILFLLCALLGITYTKFMNSSENQKFRIVKDDVILANTGVGKKFIYIAMPTVGSYNYLNDVAKLESKKSTNYTQLQKTLDIMLGFYAKNNFMLYPHAYVNDTDPYNNLAETLNANNPQKLQGYTLSNIMVPNFWKFNNLGNKHVYLKENKLFDTFKKAKYGITVYQTDGIEMCYVDNELAVERCVEKNNLPIDFDNMNIGVEQKVIVLLAQWLESMGLFEDFSYSYNMLRPFVDVDTLPMIGTSYKNIGVKNALNVLDILEKDIEKDKGNKAYFVSLNMPADMYMYDEFCKIKPIEKWQSKKDLPWVRKISDREKRQVYAQQLSCVFGRLEKFMQNLKQSSAAKNTVVVIQGVSGINGMAPSSDKNFVEGIKNKKYVDMAIYDPLRKSFKMEYDICSAPNILKQYLYRQGKCPELVEFNLHADALKELSNSLHNLKISEEQSKKAVDSFDKWYETWQQAQGNKAFLAKKVLENKPLVMPEVKPEKSAQEEVIVSEEKPQTENENINDEIPEKVIAPIKIMKGTVNNGGEAETKKLEAKIPPSEVVVAKPEPKLSKASVATKPVVTTKPSIKVEIKTPAAPIPLQ